VNTKEALNETDRFHQRCSLSTSCRAGMIVFLIGFWFDGQLFKIASAVPFWILFALTSADRK
jgi:hypothetical protein